jgi:uncharacterized SAM-binding protein YcdF (DUF218 family)
MRALLTEFIHILLSFPLYVVLALVVGAVLAWRAHRDSRLRRWRFVLAILAFAAYAVSTPALPSLLYSWVEHRYPVPEAGDRQRRDDNVIIVLSAGWWRSTPTGYEQQIGMAGWERTAAAAAVWRRIGGRILFTGAPAPDGVDSAAAAMARVARSMGIPAEALVVEPAALTTRENMLYSQRLLGEGPHTLWLLTSAFHMPRSVAAAHALGMEVIAYPCDFRGDERVTWRMLVPSNDASSQLEAALHEVIGMLAYRARGWAS